MRTIITVIGQDRVGIIAGISAVLAQANVNILDISQTILQEYFTMIMLVDLSHSALTFAELKNKLEDKGRDLGVSVVMQREEIFRTMHNV